MTLSYVKIPNSSFLADHCGKTDGAPDEPLDPGPQIDVFALDFLRVLLAYVMLLWGDVPLIRAPSIGVKAGDAKRFQ